MTRGGFPQEARERAPKEQVVVGPREKVRAPREKVGVGALGEGGPGPQG